MLNKNISYGRSHYAVTDIVALIIVLSIMTSTIVAVLYWGVPAINENKTYARTKNILTQFNMISNIIKDDIVGQGFNSSKDIKFTADKGQISITKTGTRFVLYYSLLDSFDFNVTGLDDADQKEFSFVKYGSVLVSSMTIHYLYDSSVKNIPITDPISTSKDLSGAVKIDINAGTNVVGRVWLFDVGSITYEALSDINFKATIENGGVLSGGYVYTNPIIYDENGLLYMHTIQIDRVSTSGASWGGIVDQTSRTVENIKLEDIHTQNPAITLNVKLNKTYIHEDEARIPRCFKLQVFGDSDCVNAWVLYFNMSHGFNRYKDGTAKDTLYLQKGSDIYFTLARSTCFVNLEMS
jgi:hypothetical protein